MPCYDLHYLIRLLQRCAIGNKQVYDFSSLFNKNSEKEWVLNLVDEACGSIVC
jgi:hypothetical protein